MGIWIDTDMGVDDLFAVLLVVQHRQVDGLSLSFGNAPLPHVSANAASASACFGWQMPICAGADCAVLGRVETAQHVLSETGMPSRGARLPLVQADFPPALPALMQWLESQDKAEILALGPLTNIAILLLARPDLAQNIARLTWMGGGITRGNQTASAEFNAFADPEALAVVLSRGVPLAMVDLDACRRVEITEADVTPIKHPLLKDLLGGYLDIALTRGRPAMALYDPVAAALVVQPDLFTLASAQIEVELFGQHTRGRTVVDLRDPGKANGWIVSDLHSAAVKTLCLSALEI
jgi:purine nucleosidase